MPCRLVAILLLLAAVTGCTSARSPVRREVSGFLDDYSTLREGGPGEVALVYRNPQADWKSYDKVLLEPVTLWRSGRQSLDAVPEEDLLRLVDGLEILAEILHPEAFPRRHRRGFARLAPSPRP